MKKIPCIVSVVIGAGMMSGCLHYRQLRADVSSCRADLDTLKVQVGQIHEKINGQYELVRLVRADQQVRFNEMEKQIEALSGNISESQARLSNIDEKTQELKKGWEERARADSLKATARLAEIEGLFEVALGDYQSGRRSVALAGFNDIIKRFPDSPRAEESAYWIGECYYTQKMLDEAEKSFTAYLKQFPQGKHVCGAMLKLGLVYGNKKKIESRNMVWDKLLERCPDSEEATVSKARREGK
jgi:TolA-binding protein